MLPAAPDRAGFAAMRALIFRRPRHGDARRIFESANPGRIA